MKRRNVYFRIDDNQVESDLGNWTMLLLYAKATDREKFEVLKTLFQNHDTDEEDAVFDREKLSASIHFITELAEKLKAEEELFEKFNKEEGIIALVDSDEEDDFVFLYPENNLFGDNDSNVQLLEQIKHEILEYSMRINIPHSVFVM